jgi:hypothetical protein
MFVVSNKYLAEYTKMRKKICGICPCGYSFLIIGNLTEAVEMMQLHFELSHKDLLPFGLTKLEALKLLTLTDENNPSTKSRKTHIITQ